MQRRMLITVGLVAAVIIVLLIIVATQLIPGDNPAFTTAVRFVNAAGKGDDAAALALLDAPMRAYAADHCPDGSPSACVDGFTPPEWGEMLSAVFRRATPADDGWNVEVIANYERDKGASGVCSLIHVAPDSSGAYQVVGWAGFVHCGDPGSRDMATNPDTPNRAP